MMGFEKVAGVEEFDFDERWDELMELSHLPSRDALAWLVAHGVDLSDADCGDGVGLDDVDLDGDFELFLECGFWGDDVPVIEFEDGRVARWFRSGCWD